MTTNQLEFQKRFKIFFARRVAVFDVIDAVKDTFGDKRLITVVGAFVSSVVDGCCAHY